MYASHADHVGIIDLLARVAPSCVNLADSRGRTPLMLSSMWGHEKSVTALLKVRTY
jgi:ankyrin repeat protein